MTGISSVSGTRTSDKDLYSTTKLLGASGCGSPGPAFSLGMFGRSLEYVKTLNGFPSHPHGTWEERGQHHMHGAVLSAW